MFTGKNGVIGICDLSSEHVWLRKISRFDFCGNNPSILFVLWSGFDLFHQCKLVFILEEQLIYFHLKAGIHFDVGTTENTLKFMGSKANVRNTDAISLGASILVL